MFKFSMNIFFLFLIIISHSNAYADIEVKAIHGSLFEFLGKEKYRNNIKEAFKNDQFNTQEITVSESDIKSIYGYWKNNSKVTLALKNCISNHKIKINKDCYEHYIPNVMEKYFEFIEKEYNKELQVVFPLVYIQRDMAKLKDSYLIKNHFVRLKDSQTPTSIENTFHLYYIVKSDTLLNYKIDYVPYSGCHSLDAIFLMQCKPNEYTEESLKKALKNSIVEIDGLSLGWGDLIFLSMDQTYEILIYIGTDEINKKRIVYHISSYFPYHATASYLDDVISIYRKHNKKLEVSYYRQVGEI